MEYTYHNIKAETNKYITWLPFTHLPEQEEKYYMVIQIVNSGMGDTVYICVKDENNSYIWKNIF